MRSNQRYLSFILSFILFNGILGCNNQAGKTSAAVAETTAMQPSTGDAVFNKLVGTWQSEDGKSFERWTKNDNGTFSSVAFSIKGADTSWNEQASIFPENDKWVFENKVKGQNDDKAIRFVSTFLAANSVQFSNPAHDSPTDVNYTVTDANTVNAFIIGPNGKGGKDTIPFNYTRVR